MIRPRRVVALATAIFIITATTPAGADQVIEPTLHLAGQTLFVTEDPATIVLDVVDPPDDSRIAVTIYADPRRTRDEVRDAHLDPPSTGERVAAFECTLDGNCFDQAFLETDADGQITVTMDDTVIGERLRSDSGVALPAVVSLVADTGVVLDEFATSFIVLDERSPRRVRVAFLSSLDAPVAHAPDQSIAVDAGPLLVAAGSPPDELTVTFDLRPETLTALAETNPAALADLVTALDGQALIRGPWVAMDEEAWRSAEEGEQVIDAYASGSDAVETHAGTAASSLVILDPDATPETLLLLRSIGAEAVIVEDSRLDAATVARSAMRPVEIFDANGVAMPALRVDEALHDTLDGPDAELAAVHALAELTMAAHAEGVPSDLGVLLDLDRLDRATLDRFLAIADGRREVRLSTVNSLTGVDPSEDGGAAPRGILRPTTPPDVSEVAADLRAATSTLATLSAMLEPDTAAIEPLATQLRAAVSSEFTADDARAYADAMFAEVLDRTTGIEVPVTDRITLTDRRTDLPLQVVNGQPVALNVEVILSAEKLRFPEGDRLFLQLQPGVNDLVIPVETLASGDARVTATIVSPGGAFELGSGTVDIRSTAISGLGLAISLVALVILAAWWVRTILRVRRNRAAATVAAASEEDLDAAEGES
ncbi:MAG: hypothetical protein P8J50_00495 [Acidimicrobiales bacterium]|nr:hypothetical protein [Acidimicrobiales bacterium]